VTPLNCPNCQSKNTVYKGNNLFECKDCNKNFKKLDIQLRKNPDLVKEIIVYMGKEEQNKLKKLIDEINEISNKIEKLKPLGETKEIKKIGNSAHISMGKEFLGRNALVIVFPKIE